MKKEKLKTYKTYKIYWTAEVYGVQTVKAFDEEDAIDQFNSRPDISDAANDVRLNAEIDGIVLEKKGKK